MMRQMRRSTTETTAQSDGSCVQQICYTTIEKERGRGYQAASYNRFAMRGCGCWGSNFWRDANAPCTSPAMNQKAYAGMSVEDQSRPSIIWFLQKRNILRYPATREWH